MPYGYRYYEDEEEDYLREDDQDFDLDFADPGGNSALRAAGPGNPRNLPCPTCGRPDRLTPKDKALGYQCDACADAVERGMDIDTSYKDRLWDAWTKQVEVLLGLKSLDGNEEEDGYSLDFAYDAYADGCSAQEYADEVKANPKFKARTD